VGADGQLSGDLNALLVACWLVMPDERANAGVRPPDGARGLGDHHAVSRASWPVGH